MQQPGVLLGGQQPPPPSEGKGPSPGAPPSAVATVTSAAASPSGSPGDACPPQPTDANSDRIRTDRLVMVASDAGTRRDPPSAQMRGTPLPPPWPLATAVPIAVDHARAVTWHTVPRPRDPRRRARHIRPSPPSR